MIKSVTTLPHNPLLETDDQDIFFERKLELMLNGIEIKGFSCISIYSNTIPKLKEEIDRDSFNTILASLPLVPNRHLPDIIQLEKEDGLYRPLYLIHNEPEQKVVVVFSPK